MRETPAGLILSATDLAISQACPHLVGLEMSVACGTRQRPFRPDPMADILRERGLAHEQAYVAWLQGQGRDVVDLRGVADPLNATLEAMRAGQDVIVQGTLGAGRWRGVPDVLLKTARTGAWRWSYEAVDTKLAQQTRGGTILQLGLYSELLGLAQGVVPEHFHVVTPRSGAAGERYRTADYAAYVRRLRKRLETTVGRDAEDVVASTYPEPVDHCEVCAWFVDCDTRRRQDDHLSLVADASRSQRRVLNDHGVHTLTALAHCQELPPKPKVGSLATLRRVRAQAQVQFASRGRATPLHEMRPAEAGQGLQRLPEPDAGDVFLDLEGDPFAAEGGREYLFGVACVGADGAPEYHAWWGLTHAQEAAAFRAVIAFIEARRAQHPALHVYHYAPYERSAFGRLMGRHAACEAEVDALFRGGHFVDLYQVVRQALLAGVERYSIKNLEPLYGFTRVVPLDRARWGLRAMERQLETGGPDVTPEARDLVEGYNRDDCVSTLRLRDWLEALRAGALARGIDVPRPVAQDLAPSEKVDERARRVEELRGKLLATVPSEREARTHVEQARWLLAYLLDWHRREDKAAWWEYFRLRDLPEPDLFDERQAVAGLEFVERVEVVAGARTGKATGSVIDRYRYPAQEMELRPRDTLKTRDGAFGELTRVDRTTQTIDVRKGPQQRDNHPTSAFARNHVPSDAMEESIARIAADVIAHDAGGTGGASLVARRLLAGQPPRQRSGPFERRAGEDVVPFAVRAVHDLDHSVLPIQGPPGTGKTCTGARMIRALLETGKRVGVTATSHKVVLNLLAAVIEAGGHDVHVAHLGREEDVAGAAGGIALLASNDEALAFVRSHAACVVGGTAWMWSRPEFAGSVDVLFVDEAGQMSLANAVAASPAAGSLVLLGDPQQLEQPIKGSHPEGVEASALGHVLGPHATLPADRGLFLTETWRLPPSIAEFTSKLFYEGRLTSRPGLEQQALRGTGDLGLDGSGLWLHAVDHDGCRSSSDEEVEAIATLVSRLTDGSVKWVDADGKAARLLGSDILVVAPYNAQVTRLSERLATTGARVGTVDKFQGQEAPVVLYSMTTSRPEDAPRGMEFLYSPNRLNVATSRARCAAIVVASPRLFEPECRTPRQMQLANAFCQLLESVAPGSAS